MQPGSVPAAIKGKQLDFPDMKRRSYVLSYKV